MNIYMFKVRARGPMSDSPIYDQCGMGMADSLAQAAAQLEDYFREDLISIEHLSFKSDEELLVFVSKDAFEEYSKIDCPSIDFCGRGD